MKDDYTTKSHYLADRFIFGKVSENVLINLAVKGLVDLVILPFINLFFYPFAHYSFQMKTASLDPNLKTTRTNGWIEAAHAVSTGCSSQIGLVLYVCTFRYSRVESFYCQVFWRGVVPLSGVLVRFRFAVGCSRAASFCCRMFSCGFVPLSGVPECFCYRVFSRSVLYVAYANF